MFSFFLCSPLDIYYQFSCGDQTTESANDWKLATAANIFTHKYIMFELMLTFKFMHEISYIYLVKEESPYCPPTALLTQQKRKLPSQGPISLKSVNAYGDKGILGWKYQTLRNDRVLDGEFLLLLAVNANLLRWIAFEPHLMYPSYFLQRHLARLCCAYLKSRPTKLECSSVYARFPVVLSFADENMTSKEGLALRKPKNSLKFSYFYIDVRSNEHLPGVRQNRNLAELSSVEFSDGNWMAPTVPRWK